jgi:hypothetical protein
MTDPPKILTTHTDTGLFVQLAESRHSRCLSGLDAATDTHDLTHAKAGLLAAQEYLKRRGVASQEAKSFLIQRTPSSY